MSPDAKKDNWTTMVSWSMTSGTSAETFIKNNATFVYGDFSVEQELRKEARYLCRKCGKAYPKDQEISGGFCSLCGKAYPKDQEISGGFCSLDCKYSHCTLDDKKDR